MCYTRYNRVLLFASLLVSSVCCQPTNDGVIHVLFTQCFHTLTRVAIFGVEAHPRAAINPFVVILHGNTHRQPNEIGASPFYLSVAAALHPVASGDLSHANGKYG